MHSLDKKIVDVYAPGRTEGSATKSEMFSSTYVAVKTCTAVSRCASCYRFLHFWGQTAAVLLLFAVPCDPLLPLHVCVCCRTMRVSVQ